MYTMLYVNHFLIKQQTFLKDKEENRSVCVGQYYKELSMVLGTL